MGQYLKFDILNDVVPAHSGIQLVSLESLKGITQFITGGAYTPNAVSLQYALLLEAPTFDLVTITAGTSAGQTVATAGVPASSTQSKDRL